DLPAEPRHRRHAITLQVPVLSDGTIRRHSINLPVPPVLESMDNLMPHQLDINIMVMGLESLTTTAGSEADQMSPANSSQGDQDTVGQRIPKSIIDILVTPPTSEI
ncbi:unnamed protein product, partial [Lymnaea stagnalis]